MKRTQPTSRPGEVPSPFLSLKSAFVLQPNRLWDKLSKKFDEPSQKSVKSAKIRDSENTLHLLYHLKIDNRKLQTYCKSIGYLLFRAPQKLQTLVYYQL